MRLFKQTRPEDEVSSKSRPLNEFAEKSARAIEISYSCLKVSHLPGTKKSILVPSTSTHVLSLLVSLSSDIPQALCSHCSYYLAG